MNATIAIPVEGDEIFPHFGKAAVKITKNASVQAPSLVEFHYRRSWEKGVKPIKTVRIVLYTIPGEDIWTPKCLKLEQ